MQIPPISGVPNLPSGTVTFLFTDIEGSTKRWEAQPQEMSQALSRHDAILRSTIESAGGYIFKTVGDAFCAAFATPHDALAAALSAQQALFTEQWSAATGGTGAIGPISVRMALHLGVTEERDGDYFGQPVNRIARLLSAGHGGQVLLSDPTHDLVRDDLPAGVELRDLGDHRLKDLTRPEHVFQLVAPGLPSEFPPLRTLDNRPNNLPRQQTMLVGREHETEVVCDVLRRQGATLVTLTGPAGTGKTRLALQVAADMLEEFPDGCWFVGLAALTPTDHSLVGPTIARELRDLGVSERPGEPLEETLKTVLREKEMLLVLDNFEQVIDAAPLVSTLLKAAPRLKVLVTSRVALRVYGEKEYAVPPLRLPDTRLGHMPDLAGLTQYEAVRLFIERAQDVKPDFQVTNDNAPAVAEICARLDGLPLAIELAAARVKMLPPHSLLSRLGSRTSSTSGRLKTLTGGARDLPARQQTLRNTIEWSYDLLDGGQRQLFHRMAVFQGGRTLAAVETVCNYDGNLEVEVFEGVESLLSSSLLQQREGSDGEPRFWMLETIHEYAREKLEESGDEEALRRDHALYFMALVEEAEPHLMGRNQAEWLNRLEDEHDNIRAALRWAAEEGRTKPEAMEVGLRIAGAIWRFWQRRGYYSEGREQVQGLLLLSAAGDAGGADSAENEDAVGSNKRNKSKWRAKALIAASVLAHMQADYSTARSMGEQSLAIARELGDKSNMALALNIIANTVGAQGDMPARRSLYEQSLALRREVGDKRGVAILLSSLGGMAADVGDYLAARPLYEQSLAILRELGDRSSVAGSLVELGVLAYRERDYTTARTLLEDNLTGLRELGDKSNTAYTLTWLAFVTWKEGDYSTARALLEESVTIQSELGDKYHIALSLWRLGFMAYGERDYSTARSLFAQSLIIWSECGAKSGVVASLAGLGGVAAGLGQGKRAARLMGAGETLLAAVDYVLDPDERIPYEQGMASARSQLGLKTFERARKEGRAMSMEQAIEYALEAAEVEP
jgi:predicted ATPase/class 3 adenylate cyclase